MASCDLTLELERREPVYRPGDKIRGTLHARASKDVQCNPLAVSVDWYTHGKGNRARGSTHHQEIFSGLLRAGEHSYPFELDAPDMPRAYHGEVLNVDFAVTATADIPWAFDPSVEAEIVVLHELDDYRVAPHAKESGKAPGCFLFAVGLTLLGGALLTIAIVQDTEELAQAGAVVSIFGALGVLATIRKWLAQRKTGAVTVSLSQGDESGYREVADTGQLRCEVRLEKRGARVNEVSAKLHVRERVIKGSGTNKRTFTHPIFTDEGHLGSSDEQRWVGHLRLPPRGAAPFPFRAGSNHIEWFVEVHVDIEGWPDWKGVFDLAVTPAAGAVSAQALSSS